jgi:hypothetical protein
MPATLTLTDPGELAGAIPYLLGFSPGESLVVVMTDASGTLLVTMRTDYPDSGSSVAQTAWAGYVADRVLAAKASRVGLVACTSQLERDPLTPEIVLALVNVVEEAGVEVFEFIVTDGAEHRRPGEADRSPVATHTAALTAMAVGGLSPAAGRDAVLAAVAPIVRSAPTAAQYRSARAQAATESAREHAQALVDAVDALAAETALPRPSGADLRPMVASIDVRLGSITARDYLVWSCAREAVGAAPCTRAPSARARALVEASRRSSRQYRNDTASTAGVLSYLLEGNSVVAQTLCADPDTGAPRTRLASLVLAAIESVMPPAVLASTLAEVEEDLILNPSRGRGEGAASQPSREQADAEQAAS